MKLNHVFAATLLATSLAVALPGCQTEMAAVPGNATLVASATGTSSYAVAHTGTIYIYDKSWNKLVYSGEVNAGQIIKIDTAANKILVDNQPRVEQANVGGGSEFQFFLHADPHFVQRRTITEETSPTITTERRTVIERDVQP